MSKEFLDVVKEGDKYIMTEVHTKEISVKREDLLAKRARLVNKIAEIDAQLKLMK